jgi:ribA/ribD-fused uncharacterized protein
MLNMIDYKTYIIHDDTQIAGFFDNYRWLSNFHRCDVCFDMLLYPSSENAYQAAKLIPEHRSSFTSMSPSESKKAWKFETFNKLYTPNEWNKKRFDVMSIILFDKFYRNVELRCKLIETLEKELIELNSWYDVYWGRDYRSGTGENKLGNILMNIRTYWLKGYELT